MQAVDFPRHYVLWQTEQWGRDMLLAGNMRWPKRRGAPDTTDFVGAFEVRPPCDWTLNAVCMSRPSCVILCTSNFPTYNFTPT